MENSDYNTHRLNHLVQSAEYYARLVSGLHRKQVRQQTTETVQLHSTPFYIWRTQTDGRVRDSHAANNGKIFAWNTTVPTGHPGEDWGCRCWAEPYYGDLSTPQDKPEFAKQTLITNINDGPKWSDFDLHMHVLEGNGRAITLEEIGYMADVIDHYANGLSKYKDINSHIIDAAVRSGEGAFRYTFYNTYDCQSIFWPLGESTIGGGFAGTIKQDGQYIEIDGVVVYFFRDKIKDPLSFVEKVQKITGYSRQEAEDYVGNAGDFLGEVIGVKDTWKTKFTARKKLGTAQP